MQAILQELQRPRPRGACRHHDIMAFQEMWSRKTYEIFRKTLYKSHPHSHYYRTTSMGSGLAIFSRYPIIKIGFHRYTLNGDPLKIYDGDWFVGKGVGHARIKHPEGIIDAFTTHLIADYSEHCENSAYGLFGPRKRDNYEAHRITQTYEMLRFVETNMDPKAKAVFLLGDFNFSPQSRIWRAFIRNHGRLRSIFSDMAHGDLPCTCGCLENGYNKNGNTPVTIDHILHAPTKTHLLAWDLAFVGDLPFSTQHGCIICPKAYSDHFGISAVFEFAPKGLDKAQSSSIVSVDDSKNMLITVLEDETRISSSSNIMSGFSGLVFFIISLLILALTVFVMANPAITPTFLFYLILGCFPFLLLLSIIHLFLCIFHYPNEMAALHEFIQELVLIKTLTL